MSRAAALLAEVQAAGAIVSEVDGALRVRAPVGILSSARRQDLSRHKVEILALLAAPWASDAWTGCANSACTGRFAINSKGHSVWICQDPGCRYGRVERSER